MAASTNAGLRLLPSIDELLRNPAVEALVAAHGRAVVLHAARQRLQELRSAIVAQGLESGVIEARLAELPGAILQNLQTSVAHSLRAVINATGVILHTNLGRAPLSDAALQHVIEVSRGYSNLEFDLSTGERGVRDVHVSALLAKLLS